MFVSARVLSRKIACQLDFQISLLPFMHYKTQTDFWAVCVVGARIITDYMLVTPG